VSVTVGVIVGVAVGVFVTVAVTVEVGVTEAGGLIAEPRLITLKTFLIIVFGGAGVNDTEGVGEFVLLGVAVGVLVGSGEALGDLVILTVEVIDGVTVGVSVIHFRFSLSDRQYISYR